MVEAIKSANLGLRFMLEMAALGAVGFWGFRLDRATMVRWVVGIGVPLAVVVVWSLYLAPGSDGPLPAATKMWVGSLVLGACAATLAAANRPALAGLFGVAIVVNTVLMQIWNQ